MTDSNEKQLEVGGDFLESLAAANLANWQAINEMTANSIDAWFDMNSKTHQLVIDIQINQQRKSLFPSTSGSASSFLA